MSFKEIILREGVWVVIGKAGGELRFIGLMAGKVGAADQQQRITYEANNNTDIA